jgi:DNA helicase II / ATP-dependent DNA helicase PcrA
MKATRSSYCPFCKGKILVGQEITRKGTKWGHAVCDGAVEVESFGSYVLDFIPSVHQAAVFDAILNTNNNIVVRAVAGSGKTTTLKGAMNSVAQWAIKHNKNISDVTVVFVAFNKRIADALKDVLPKWVKVQTLHSFGLSAIRNAFPKIKVEKNKLYEIIDYYPEFKLNRELGDEDPNIVRNSLLVNLVSKVKNTLTDPNDTEAILALCDHHGIDLNGDADLILETLPKVLNDCKRDTKQVDFDDMIWFPHVLKLHISPVDFLFVDEAQDLNLSQIEMILSACPAGRIIAVGDPAQSIYGFRGADVEAMPNLTRRINAITLPLSVCYRCPTSHLELARQYVPEIEARENAPEGEILRVNPQYFEDNVKQGDLVISRVNAPLIPYCYSLLRRGIKAIVYGREIGFGLKSLAKKNFASDYETMVKKLLVWRTKEVVRLTAKNASDTTIQSVEDRIETVLNILAECKETKDIYKQIDTIFQDEVAAVTLSSVHKAKGLESDNVWILKPELLPLVRKDQKDWEIQQESNIVYVSYTRAKNKLIFVEEEK